MRPSPWSAPFLSTLGAVCLILTAANPVAAAGLTENTDQPAAGRLVLQLEEQWRIGGENDEENLLGVINQAIADVAGNLYLLDIQLAEVQVFSPEGKYLRSLGGAGDGPGELRRPADLVFMPDGTVGLVQTFPGRIVQVDLEGIPAGEWLLNGDNPTAGGFFMLQRAASLGGNLVLSGARISRGETTRTAVNFISRFTMDQTEQVTFKEKTSVREFRGMRFSEQEIFFPHQGGWALAPDGRVYVAPERNAFLIEVFGPSGDLERTFTRQYQSWQRTDEELATARESMIPSRRRNRNAPEAVVEPTERDILNMHVAPDGRLWVLPSRGIKNQPEGIHSTWDVFDDRGNYVQAVSFACEGEPGRDAIFFAGDDLVILVKEHAEAMKAFRGQGNDVQESDLDARPLEVVCYRIVP